MSIENTISAAAREIGVNEQDRWAWQGADAEGEVEFTVTGMASLWTVMIHFAGRGAFN